MKVQALKIVIDFISNCYDLPLNDFEIDLFVDAFVLYFEALIVLNEVFNDY